MPKKKTIKHINFYKDCMVKKRIPRVGLCSCAIMEYIDESLLNRFVPDDSIDTRLTFWASGIKDKPCYFRFTKLRQTIVLFMAAINGEL